MKHREQRTKELKNRVSSTQETSDHSLIKALMEDKKVDRLPVPYIASLVV